MRIGIYVTTLNPAGASQRRMQSQIFHALADANAPDLIFVVFSHDAQHVRLGPSFTHQPLGGYGLAYGLKRLKALSQAFRYHLPPQGPWFNPLGWLRAFKLAIKEPSHYTYFRKLNIRLLYNMNQHHLPAPVPFIQTVWDANHRVHPFFPEFSYSRYGFDQLDRDLSRCLPKASFVITGTHAGGQQLCTFYRLSPERIRVIPLPAPKLDHPIAHSIDLPTTPYLFYPARFWPHKDHITLIHALSHLRSSYGVRIHLVLTGQDSGGLAYILETAESLGVRDQLRVLGNVPDEALPQLYRNALALVFASPVGPDNLPPLEAMVLNCPVIAARSEGSDEQLQESALFFDPYNDSQLAEQIWRLHNDPLLRDELIHRGQDLVQQRSPSLYAQKLHAIFAEFRLIGRSWERADSKIC